MIKNVIFDIGKVLTNVDFLRSIRNYTNTEEQAIRVHEAISKDDTWAYFDKGTKSTEEIVEKLVANDPEVGEYTRAFVLGMKDLFFAYDFTDAWIQSVKEDGKGVYILSNWPEHVYEQFKDEMWFLDKVDGYILSYRDKVIKPEAEIYNLLLDRFGLKAEECVFVDDRKENTEGAEAVGITGVLFETKEQVEADLRALGVNIKG